MTIFPAIDLYKGEAVRLSRGDFSQMTVYSDDPVNVALGFKNAGAAHMHVVDLEGARDGVPANFEIIRRIAVESKLDIQVGGGVRSVSTVEKYLNIGVKRVILGTAVVTTPGFIQEIVRLFGDSIAVGVDIKGGRVAIKGWTELSSHEALEFCRETEDAGVQTLICTDISRDGMLGGTSIELYRTMREKLSMKLVASGGISTLEDIEALSALQMDGAILGKALYTGAIKLEEAIRISK